MSLPLFIEDKREKLINDLDLNYEFVKVETFAKSVCLRDIKFLQIGNRNYMVLWVGAFHGMEWLTSFLLLKFLKNLCTNIKSEKRLFGIDIFNQLQKRGLLVIPCLNPDGVEISTRGSDSAGKYKNFIKEISKGNTSSWQANAHGVDLNHNYNAGWEELHELELKNGITGPAITRYGGTSPESEPETQALVNLCKKYNFEHAIAFHSQGEEIYWRYGDSIPKKSFLLAKLFAVSSGYTLSAPEGLAVGGGFKDWFISEFNKPGFTVEIGKGKNPLLFSELDAIYEKLEKMLYISALI